jgi:hypothetical protein
MACGVPGRTGCLPPVLPCSLEGFQGPALEPDSSSLRRASACQFGLCRSLWPFYHLAYSIMMLTIMMICDEWSGSAVGDGARWDRADYSVPDYLLVDTGPFLGTVTQSCRRICPDRHSDAAGRRGQGRNKNQILIYSITPLPISAMPWIRRFRRCAGYADFGDALDTRICRNNLSRGGGRLHSDNDTTRGAVAPEQQRYRNGRPLSSVRIFGRLSVCAAVFSTVG